MTLGMSVCKDLPNRSSGLQFHLRGHLLGVNGSTHLSRDCNRRIRVLRPSQHLFRSSRSIKNGTMKKKMEKERRAAQRRVLMVDRKDVDDC